MSASINFNNIDLSSNDSSSYIGTKNSSIITIVSVPQENSTIHGNGLSNIEINASSQVPLGKLSFTAISAVNSGLPHDPQSSSVNIIESEVELTSPSSLPTTSLTLVIQKGYTFTIMGEVRAENVILRGEGNVILGPNSLANSTFNLDIQSEITVIDNRPFNASEDTSCKTDNARKNPDNDDNGPSAFGLLIPSEDNTNDFTEFVGVVIPSCA